MALSDSLIAYFSLDEASGSAIDAHGSNDLTETSGTIGSAAGKQGNARDFEAGDTEYFEIADNADMSVGDIDFTFAFWINAESLANFCGVFQKDNNPGAEREFGLYWTSDNTLRFYVFSGSGGSGFKEVQISFSTVGSWVFVCCWHDSVSNQIALSLNAGSPQTASHTTGVYNGTAPFILGQGGGSWDGLIDEFGFWKRVLTSDERTELYNSGSGVDYAYISGGAAPTTTRLVGPKLVSGHLTRSRLVIA